MRKYLNFTLFVMGLSLIVLGWNFIRKSRVEAPLEININQSDGNQVAQGEDSDNGIGEVPVLLYFSNNYGTKLNAEKRMVSGDTVKSDVATTVVRELLKGPAPETGLQSPIPNGTKLLNQVKVENGIATVDLSEEFVNNLSKEANADSLAIFSIVNSLVEIKEISKVRFTIDGVIKNQVGRFMFNAPFQKSESIIDKNAEIKTTRFSTEEQESGIFGEYYDDIDAIRELTDEELEEVFKAEIDFYE